MESASFAMMLVLVLGGSHMVDYSQLEDGAISGRSSRATGDTTLVHSFDLTDAMRTHFLDAHNEFRRSVTPTASDMRELTWDSELEALAKQYASMCLFEHSSGLSTSMFSPIGENIHRGDSNPDGAPTAAATAWNNETQFYTYDTNTCDDGQVCGHYLALNWAKTYKVGCGISLCNDLLPNNLDGFLTICQYGPAGLTSTIIDSVQVSDIPYQSGEACSACDSSLVCVNNLCAVNATTSTTTTTESTTTTTASPTTTVETTIATEPTTTTATEPTTTTATEPTTTTMSTATSSNQTNNATMMANTLPTPAGVGNNSTSGAMGSFRTTGPFMQTFILANLWTILGFWWF